MLFEPPKTLHGGGYTQIHIQTLNPEGQTSSQGPYGQTLRSLGAKPKRGIQKNSGILSFLYFLDL